MFLTEKVVVVLLAFAFVSLIIRTKVGSILDPFVRLEFVKLKLRMSGKT